MKYLWIVFALFLMQVAKAQTMTVGDVKVSVRADSAASAREQALDQAHQLAFQKLLNQNFPERVIPLPSQELLRDMVSDFSIDREKTTPTSYTAALTFQFDESQVRAWVQQLQHGQTDASSAPFLQRAYETLKLTASYTSHSDWQYIKKTLENFPGVQTFFVSTLSPQNANLEIIYNGSPDQLRENLQQKGIVLSQQINGWNVSLDEQALHSPVIVD